MNFKQPITYPNGLKVSIQDDYFHRFPGRRVEVSVYDTVEHRFITETVVTKAKLDAGQPNDGLFVFIPAEQLSLALSWTATWQRLDQNIS